MQDDDDRRGDDSDDSYKKSKVSFSYWGADKITVQKPMLKGRALAGINVRKGNITASYGRESSANTKFGTRLVSDGSSHSHRPSSRRQTSTPTSRRPAPSEEGPNYARATITRPAWDASTRAHVPYKRQRNTSQPSTTSKTPTSQSTDGYDAVREAAGQGVNVMIGDAFLGVNVGFFKNIFIQSHF